MRTEYRIFNPKQEPHTFPCRFCIWCETEQFRHRYIYRCLKTTDRELVSGYKGTCKIVRVWK